MTDAAGLEAFRALRNSCRKDPPYDAKGYQAASPTDMTLTANLAKALVDTLHQAGIGVILDWVPGHFPSDPFALATFDARRTGFTTAGLGSGAVARTAWSGDARARVRRRYQIDGAHRLVQAVPLPAVSRVP